MRVKMKTLKERCYEKAIHVNFEVFLYFLKKSEWNGR